MMSQTPPPANGDVPGVVLLVDDDDAVRAFAKLVLEMDGWHVLAAHGGDDACRLAGEHAGVIRLVVTDISMPDVSGPDLAARLGRIVPGLRVLYISGSTADEAFAGGNLVGRANYLNKPFTPGALTAKVRRVAAAVETA